VFHDHRSNFSYQRSIIAPKVCKILTSFGSTLYTEPAYPLEPFASLVPDMDCIANALNSGLLASNIKYGGSDSFGRNTINSVDPSQFHYEEGNQQNQSCILKARSYSGNNVSPSEICFLTKSYDNTILIPGAICCNSAISTYGASVPFFNEYDGLISKLFLF